MRLQSGLGPYSSHHHVRHAQLGCELSCAPVGRTILRTVASLCKDLRLQLRRSDARLIDTYTLTVIQQTIPLKLGAALQPKGLVSVEACKDNRLRRNA